METTNYGWKYISAIFDVLLEECQKNESHIEPQFIFRGITKRHFTTSKTIKKDLNIIEEKLKKRETPTVFSPNMESDDKIKTIYSLFYDDLKNYFRQPIDIKGVKEQLSKVMRMDCLTYSVPEYINSGAVVRMQQHSKKISKIDFINYNKHMLSDLKNRFPIYADENYSDIEILADVQHKGAASCLIDFSTDFLTSLWFATQGHLEEVGFLFCYDINKEMLEEDQLYILSPKYISRSIEDLLNETTKQTKYKGNKSYKFWLWKPSNLNERIIMQDSVFVFGLEPFFIKHHKIITIPIPPDWKKPIQHVLKSFFGITAESIFYDTEGYAESNSKLKPYVKTYLHYFSEQFDRGNSNIELDELQNGMECLFQSEYDLALKYFTLYESKTDNLHELKFDWNKYNSTADKKDLFTYLKYHALNIDVHYSKGLCLKHLGEGNEYGAIKELLIARTTCEDLKNLIDIKPEHLHLEDDDLKHLNHYNDYVIQKLNKTNNDLLDLYYTTQQYNKIINYLNGVVITNYSESTKYSENDFADLCYFINMLYETICIEALYDKIDYMNLITKEKNTSNQVIAKGNHPKKKGYHPKKTDNYNLLDNINKQLREIASKTTNKKEFKKTQPLYNVLICYYKCIYDILNGSSSHIKDFEKSIENGSELNDEYKKDYCFTNWDLSNIMSAIKEIKRFNNRMYVELMTLTSQVTDFMNFVQGRIKDDNR